jgi:hypothetical protein
VIQLPWSRIAKYAAPVVLALLAWWQVRAYADRVADGREKEVRALWDADEAEEKRVADAAAAAAKLQDAADAARNKEIADGYAKNLAARAADNARLARLLRQATAAADSLRAGQGADQPGAAPASPPGSDGPPVESAGIHQLIADALTEARQNADQLDAVLGQIKPQM